MRTCANLHFICCQRNIVHANLCKPPFYLLPAQHCPCKPVQKLHFICYQRNIVHANLCKPPLYLLPAEHCPCKPVQTSTLFVTSATLSMQTCANLHFICYQRNIVHANLSKPPLYLLPAQHCPCKPVQTSTLFVTSATLPMQTCAKTPLYLLPAQHCPCKPEQTSTLFVTSATLSMQTCAKTPLYLLPAQHLAKKSF